MNLFQRGDFLAHSGEVLSFKIQCDALTDRDMACLALMVAERVPAFSSVIGVPTGGDRLAKALAEYTTDHSTRLLIVDDVLTTGASMNAEFEKQARIFSKISGAVLFARGYCPAWVTPLFTLASVEF